MNPGFHLVLGRWKSGFTCFSVGLAVMISFSRAALCPGDVVAIGVWLPWSEHQILSGHSCPACSSGHHPARLPAACQLRRHNDTPGRYRFLTWVCRVSGWLVL